MKTVKCHRCGKELVTDDYNTDGKAYYCQWCAPIARQEEWNAQHGCKSITIRTETLFENTVTVAPQSILQNKSSAVFGKLL